GCARSTYLLLNYPPCYVSRKKRQYDVRVVLIDAVVRVRPARHKFQELRPHHVHHSTVSVPAPSQHRPVVRFGVGYDCPPVSIRRLIALAELADHARTTGSDKEIDILRFQRTCAVPGHGVDVHREDYVAILEGRYAAGSTYRIRGNFSELTGPRQIDNEWSVVISANLPYRNVILVREGFRLDGRMAPFIHDVDQKWAGRGKLLVIAVPEVDRHLHVLRVVL